MGLDMYILHRVKADKNDKSAEDSYSELAYWRKANQIRNWFVNNTDLEYDDNCKDIPLDRKTLENLVEDCQTVLNDHSLAEEIIPTQGGFFFGGTDYNEYYFEDLKYTVEKIKEILDNTPDEDFDNGNIVYYEWW